MKSVLLTCVLAGLASAVALPAVDQAPTFVNYMTWIGTVTVGGEDLTLTGSAESIYAQILAINPLYDTELGIKSPQSLKKRGEDLESVEVSLAKRDPIDYGSLNCQAGTRVFSQYASAAGNALASIGNGLCPAGPGPGWCQRVACDSTQSSGIWFCNDRNVAVATRCSNVVEQARYIISNCQRSMGGPVYVQGQIFSGDRTWNTIVSHCQASP